MTMIVTASAHERALAGLVVQLDEAGLPESAGIHGPDSLMWQMNAQLSNFLGAGRAMLLQLAHPYVAYAIAEHSTTLSDVRGRFQATFENVFGMTFGSRSQALASARRVHMVHARIHGKIPVTAGRFAAGHHYHANDSDALLWVHATLIGTALRIQEIAGDPSSGQDRDALYEASKRFALLFGLDSNLVPAGLRDFEDYVEGELAGATLVVSPPALAMSKFLLKAPTRALRPVFALYRALTAKLLPPRLRDGYGLRFGVREEVMAGLLLAAARASLPVLPRGLRTVPEAMLAEIRLGLQEESALSRWLERKMQAGLSLWT